MKLVLAFGAREQATSRLIAQRVWALARSLAVSVEVAGR